MLSAKMLPPSTQRKASSLWQRWLGKRFAVEQSKVLQQRDIFVFFNREGYIYFMLLLLTFIAGINYANNLILAMCFLLSGILILSFYLAFLQLYGLTVSYQVPALGQVGSALVVPLNFYT